MSQERGTINQQKPSAGEMEKVRQKIIREKSKIYKNSQMQKKITKLPSKKVPSHENRLKNALFTDNNVIL
jgi:hypothetical protein